MSSNLALIELAKQVTEQQQEIEALRRKLQMSQKKLPKKLSTKEQQQKKARIWIERKYAEDWELAVKKREKEINKLKSIRPDFTLHNDCMEVSINNK